MTRKDKEELLRHAKEEISKRIAAMKLEGVVTFSAAEICGMLDITPPTLTEMKLPKVDLTGKGNANRFTLEALREGLEKRTTRGGAR